MKKTHTIDVNPRDLGLEPDDLDLFRERLKLELEGKPFRRNHALSPAEQILAAARRVAAGIRFEREFATTSPPKEPE